MGNEAEIRRERITRLLDQVIRPATHPAAAPLRISISRLPGEPVPPEEASALTFSPFQVGDGWGGAWSTAWFQAEGVIPEEFDGSHVVARIDLGYHSTPGFGGEALVFTGLGHPVPLQGVNPKHNAVSIAAAARAGDSVELLVEAAANPGTSETAITGRLLQPDYEGAPLYRLSRFDLAVVDDAMAEVLYDWTVLAELVDALGLSHPRSAEILYALDAIARAVDLEDLTGSIVAKAERWKGLLDRRTSPHAHRVTAVGHAHIDSAWLWPIRETRRKCARTLATALRLMEAYPEYVFVCSQAQQHAWMKAEHPALFDQMRRRVGEGRLEPVGSMWVEPDTNLPSGESLVRQLVHGKRFFLDNYGIETLDCWLPDAFGYSGNLPQILRAANVSRFLTQKLSWNEINAFPHHTFWWEGIDGSRVLAHCPPTDTYNGEFALRQLLEGDARYAQHGISERSLYVYGHGDGGGGPTEEMLERARRLRDLDPLPRVELGTAWSYFEAVERECAEAEARDGLDGDKTVATAHAPGPGGLPVWVGELYLERHRGVQTTQARGKLGNRRSENLLREAELWAAATLTGEQRATAQAKLERAWELVLLHQFHDILPGSSIHWVHEDAQMAYADVRELAENVIAEATARLADNLSTRETALGKTAPGTFVVVLNAASHERLDVVELELDGTATGQPVAARGPDGTPVPVQVTAEGTLLFPASVPGSGWSCYELVTSAGGRSAEEDPSLDHDAEVLGGRTLSNGLVSVTLDDEGLVSSLEDLVNGREVIPAGERGNVFQLHHDLPNHYDAWDVDLGTFARAAECTSLDSMEVVEQGPVRAAIRIRRSIGRSSALTQDVRLSACGRRVEFVTHVEWHERHRLLKTSFPVAVRSPHATYEIQFGHVERPTHANTSWDAAKFEVPAQRWAELSEPGFGVALLNDCKHGYDIRRNVMRLSLLRGPGWPDPEADAGGHRFSYAMLPHGERLGAGSVTREAECFNLPLRSLRSARPVQGTGSLVSVDGATLSAVKHADDGSDDLVVRLYEHLGAHTAAVLRLPGAKSALRADLLERPGEPVPVDGDRVVLELRPFELVTLRVTRA